VLLLGVGHDCNTTVHVAEHLARVRYRLPKHATVLENGRPRRYEYGETDHCCEGFAHLARSRDIVDAALEHLLEDETVFLHPAQAPCVECRAARSTIGS